MPERHLHLLSLDGGGVRGLSSLMILKHLMQGIDPNADVPPKPCDYFDMIGGTSTGGLIAVMLGRLRMSVDECIDAYIKLSDNIFQRLHSLPVKLSGKIQARFDSGALEKAVQKIVAENDPSNNSDLLLYDDNSNPCHVFVCATSKELARTIKLTSYRNPRYLGDLLQTTKIWQAARATSAASTFFEPIEIGPYHEEFVDGASGANNPVRELWTEASDMWKDAGPLHETIKCLVSIGTGVPAIRSFGSNMLEVAKILKNISLETENTARKFGDEHYQLRLEGRYFRFNVSRGLEDVGLEHAKKSREIAAATRDYISEMKDEMEKCSVNLRERPHGAAAREPSHHSPFPDTKGSHTFPTFDPSSDISRNFIERPGTLQTIEDCLDQSPIDPAKTPGPRVAVIHGLAGSGKSQIALKFAERWLERNTSFYWFDASSSSTIDQSFRAFARDALIIDAAASISDDSAYIRRKVCKWIANLESNWLLVYDNYDIMELQDENDYDVSKCFPLSTSGRVLVTTRNKEVRTVTGGNLVDIGILTEEEAIALFVRSANFDIPDKTSDEWNELRQIACHSFGSYPLAIAQGASYLRLGYSDETSLISKLQRYKEQYALHEISILKADNGMKVREYGRSVITTWDMSFEVIVSNNPAAAELLLLFGFFHHQNITADLFLRAFERRQRMLQADGIDLAEPAFSWFGRLLTPAANGAWDRDFYFDVALTLLINYSLVQRTTGGAWNVHPLVHKWTVIGKQHPRLSGIQDRGRLALSMLGGMYDSTADYMSINIYQQKIMLSNHMTSVVKTVQRYTKLLNLRARPAVKASTLLRVNQMFDAAVQTSQQKAQRLGTTLTLQALACGSVQDGIDHISTLQSLRAVIYDFSGLNVAYPEQTTELVEIPMNLLPKVAENDPDIKLEAQLLEFQSMLIVILSKSSQYEKAKQVIEKLLQFVNEHEFDMDEFDIFRFKGTFMSMLRNQSNVVNRNDESKRLLLRNLEDFHEDCQSELGESHKITVEALLDIGLMLRELGDNEKAKEILRYATTLCERNPEVLAHVYQNLLLNLTRLPLGPKQTVEGIEAFEKLIDIVSKISGPFDLKTIDHKYSLCLWSSLKALQDDNKYHPMIMMSDMWEGADDAIWKITSLALSYKVAGEAEEIDDLWDGTIEHIILEESPGVSIDEFVYTFEVAAEESKHSSYQEAYNIMQRQVTGLKDLKVHIVQSIGFSKSALLKLLKDFWNVVDSIGPFASTDPLRPVADHYQRNQPLEKSDIKSERTKEQKPRKPLGQIIISKIRSAPKYAKPYMLFICIRSLDLYYDGERTQDAVPFDTRSIDLLLEMAKKQFGEAHTLTLRMYFVNAISSHLLHPTNPHRREESERSIMDHRFHDISQPGNPTSRNASFVFERLIAEYRKRHWYPLCLRLHQITFSTLCRLLGACNNDTLRSLWFLLEMHWRANLDDEDGRRPDAFMQFLQETTDGLYQNLEPDSKERFMKGVREGGRFLMIKDLPEAASLVFRHVLTWPEHEQLDAMESEQTQWDLDGALAALRDDKDEKKKDEEEKKEDKEKDEEESEKGKPDTGGDV